MLEPADLLFCIYLVREILFLSGKDREKSGIFVIPVATMSQKCTEFAGI